jgi:hypothetical protein
MTRRLIAAVFSWCAPVDGGGIVDSDAAAAHVLVDRWWAACVPSTWRAPASSCESIIFLTVGAWK